jgi:hypothetical protein
MKLVGGCKTEDTFSVLFLLFSQYFFYIPPSENISWNRLLFGENFKQTKLKRMTNRWTNFLRNIKQTNQSFEN